MKHVLTALVLVILFSEGVLGQNVAPAGNIRRPRADAAIADAVQGMFIAQFQEQVQVSDDQYVRILPILRQGIDSMRTSANRSSNAFNQLRVMIRRNAPDDNIHAQIQELDEANRQTK